MSPRTTVAITSLVAIGLGVVLLVTSAQAELAFVTSNGAACDGLAQLGDCFPAEPRSPVLASLLTSTGLLGLIYARLLMSRSDLLIQ
ncbi:hypothetical protein [Amycolatopsis sp. FDAARGOS 1241]|uniref:hypothetical protein n=1 Tax=Amycolatopsis sp. FDAARGOS 1241 TaxID=2778070 RepID=UPI00194E3514|nr:hypothetical protein [Amycolatopsis sp. FDAARGOS 1241]QRP48261.1 hypothetical protein I6J71_10540 [Amycolatopsis sp. FDAARGOS 1241]